MYATFPFQSHSDLNLDPKRTLRSVKDVALRLGRGNPKLAGVLEVLGKENGLNFYSGTRFECEKF